MGGNSGGVEQMLKSRGEDGAAQNERNGGILVIGNICRSKKCYDIPVQTKG